MESYLGMIQEYTGHMKVFPEPGGDKCSRDPGTVRTFEPQVTGV